jgi:hypothetical protein
MAVCCKLQHRRIQHECKPVSYMLPSRSSCPPSLVLCKCVAHESPSCVLARPPTQQVQGSCLSTQPDNSKPLKRTGTCLTRSTECIQVAGPLLPVCAPHALQSKRLCHHLSCTTHAARGVKAQDDWTHLCSRPDLLQGHPASSHEANQQHSVCEAGCFVLLAETASLSTEAQNCDVTQYVVCIARGQETPSAHRMQSCALIYYSKTQQFMADVQVCTHG